MLENTARSVRDNASAPMNTEEDVEQERNNKQAPPLTKEQKKALRLEQLERRKNKIESQIKALTAKEKEKERKERTRRLIQIGALSEKYFHCPDIEPQQYEEFLKKAVEVPEVKKMLR